MSLGDKNERLAFGGEAIIFKAFQFSKILNFANRKEGIKNEKTRI